MEPEGYDSPLTYPQGMSMTFPPEIQQKIINAVCGLENAVVTRPGYGVHYDFVDPRQLKPSLETKLVCGLFLAGQINGTTGYEEAAAQGIVAVYFKFRRMGFYGLGRAFFLCPLMGWVGYGLKDRFGRAVPHGTSSAHAGMNAACAVQEKDPFVMNRSHGYIGVLIDDLTSLGTSEPYRMFTSRVEFRLLLRPDNADLRLTAEGYKRGVVGQKRFDEFSKTKKRFYDSLKMLTSLKKTKEQWSTIFPGCFHGKSSIETQQISGLHLIVGYNNSFDNVFETLGGDFRQFIGDEKLQNRLAIESMYRHSVRGAASQVKAVQQEAAMSIPDDFDFDSDQLRKCVSFECVEKLILHRPTTIGAASRIPGMTPASLFSLFLEVKKRTMQLANVGNVAEVDI
uniref:tRNA uridine 5-carboxymethylaminomethyl modification enzyme C-terminal subdomain domain-containing protein n=1 Tax=Romanomermis culicivorax TaxID=13658 RepID=A0A915K0Q0_ROMCU